MKPKTLRFVSKNPRSCLQFMYFGTARSLQHWLQNQGITKPSPDVMGFCVRGSFEFDDEPGEPYNTILILVSRHRHEVNYIVHEASHAADNLMFLARRAKVLSSKFTGPEIKAQLTGAIAELMLVWRNLGYPRDIKDTRPFKYAHRYISQCLCPT